MRRTGFGAARGGARMALVLLLGMSSCGALAAGPGPFPVPVGLSAAVQFWIGVYTEVDLDQGAIHDDQYLNVVYEHIDYDSKARPKQRQHWRDAALARWRALLAELADQPLREGARHRKVSAMLHNALGRPPFADDFQAAAERLRFQLGQRSRFIEGLKRAGRYERRFRRILKSHGVPDDLAYLPHVESSFNTRAYSHAGAAGLWQFIRPTAKRYLRVDAVVDERMDPFRATAAAAKLLRTNHARLGNWPLALTAYNYGRAGMARAVEQTNSRDLSDIIRHYEGGRFGFSARNFYAQFIASRRIARDVESFFPGLKPERPARLIELKLPFYADAETLAERFEVDSKTLRSHNLALSKAVWRGEKRIPKGFLLRVPTTSGSRSDSGALLKRIPASKRYAKQLPSLPVHIVRRGESLARIAARYRVSVSRLAALNKVRKLNQIKVGQRLRIPKRK